MVRFITTMDKHFENYMSKNRKTIIETIAEDLLNSSICGGDHQEREEVRRQSLIPRLKIAVAVYEIMEKNGYLKNETKRIRRGRGSKTN